MFLMLFCRCGLQLIKQYKCSHTCQAGYVHFHFHLQLEPFFRCLVYVFYTNCKSTNLHQIDLVVDYEFSIDWTSVGFVRKLHHAKRKKPCTSGSIYICVFFYFHCGQMCVWVYHNVKFNVSKTLNGNFNEIEK